jgi:hypothetical protein
MSANQAARAAQAPTAADADALVFVGTTGDLAYKQIFKKKQPYLLTARWRAINIFVWPNKT